MFVNAQFQELELTSNKNITNKHKLLITDVDGTVLVQPSDSHFVCDKCNKKWTSHKSGKCPACRMIECKKCKKLFNGVTSICYKCANKRKKKIWIEVEHVYSEKTTNRE